MVWNSGLNLVALSVDFVRLDFDLAIEVILQVYLRRVEYPKSCWGDSKQPSASVKKTPYALVRPVHPVRRTVQALIT